MQIRVIFAGITGLRKKRLIEPLAKWCAREKGLPDDLNNVETRKFIRIFDLEEEIIKRQKIQDVPTFLDSGRIAQRMKWNNTFDMILKEIEDEQPEVVFLAMHFTYQRGVPFSLIDLGKIEKFKPSIIITLADDCYHIWKEIREREKRRPTGSYLRLKDILFWTLAEKTVADIVAEALSIDNVLIGIKHPLKTFYDLLFSDKPVAYLCHPIGKVWEEPEERRQAIFEEINNFRQKLQERCVVFEPATIDERPLIRLYNNVKRTGGNRVVFRKGDRWPLETDRDEYYPVELPLNEVAEVVQPDPVYKKTLIDYYIVERDFQYIINSDVVIAYRPTYRGGGRGREAEINFARLQASRPVYGFISPDDPELGGSPFEGKVVPCDTIDKLLEVVTHIKRKVLKLR